jgi:hypothetical protein
VDFDPSVPPEIQNLRASLWPIVNWLIPMRVQPATGGEVDYFALRAQLLPRVPISGEWLIIPRYHAPVDRVEWTDDGRVVARLKEIPADASYLDELERAGWLTFPPPAADDWLKRLEPE